MKTNNPNELFEQELFTGVSDELRRLNPFQRYLTEQYFGLGGNGERSLKEIAAGCGADAKDIDEELTNVLRELRRMPKDSAVQCDAAATAADWADIERVTPVVTAAEGEVFETLNWVVLLQNLQEGRSPLNGARH